MKRFLLPVLLLLSAPLFALGYLLISFAEPRGISLTGITTRLYVPSSVRNLPVLKPCEPPVVSRSWMECGGICGVIYDVSYRSRASTDELSASFDGYRDVLVGFTHEIDIKPSEPSGCRLVEFDIWRDTRTSAAR